MVASVEIHEWAGAIGPSRNARGGLLRRVSESIALVALGAVLTAGAVSDGPAPRAAAPASVIAATPVATAAPTPRPWFLRPAASTTAGEQYAAPYVVDSGD